VDVSTAARDVLTPLGYEVLEVTVSTKGRTPKILVRIDRLDEAAVTIEDVRNASEAFGLELDRLDPFDGAYDLEVESPGSSRPLVTARHFERFHDLRAKVRTDDRAFTGVIRTVQDDHVTFEVDGDTILVPLSAVRSARLAEWPDEPR